MASSDPPSPARRIRGRGRPRPSAEGGVVLADSGPSHETHPGIFALQPDGTRNGHPSPRNAKLCQSNPKVWETFPDVQWANATHFATDGLGVSQWTLVGTRGDGAKIEADGVDLFSFRDGKVATKKAFRKDRPLIGAA